MGDAKGHWVLLSCMSYPILYMHLWGHDILNQMEILLYNLSHMISHQILHQRFNTLQSLGKTRQGKTTSTGLMNANHKGIFIGTYWNDQEVPQENNMHLLLN